MLRPEMRHIFRKRRRTNFKLGIQTEHEDPHHNKTFNVKGEGRNSRDVYDRCWPISRKRNVLEVETPKLIERLSTPRAITRTSFKVRGKVNRPTNAETGSASHLSKGKAYELQTWYTDGVRKPVSPTSGMASKVKGQGRKVT